MSPPQGSGSRGGALLFCFDSFGRFFFCGLGLLRVGVGYAFLAAFRGGAFSHGKSRNSRRPLTVLHFEEECDV